jgi:hypothetical protein
MSPAVFVLAVVLLVVCLFTLGLLIENSTLRTRHAEDARGIADLIRDLAGVHAQLDKATDMLTADVRDLPQTEVGEAS